MLKIKFLIFGVTTCKSLEPDVLKENSILIFWFAIKNINLTQSIRLSARSSKVFGEFNFTDANETILKKLK